MGGLSLDAQGDYLEEFLAAMDESLLEFAMLQEVPQLGGPRPPPLSKPAAKRARTVDKPAKKEIPDSPTPHILAKQYDTHTLVQAWHEAKAAPGSTERLSATRRGPNYSEHEQHHDALADNTDADVEEEHDQHHDELADNQIHEDQKNDCPSETREPGSAQHEPETSTNLDDGEEDNVDQGEPQRRGQKRKRQADQARGQPQTVPEREEANMAGTRGPIAAEERDESATPTTQLREGDHDDRREDDRPGDPDTEGHEVDPKPSEK